MANVNEFGHRSDCMSGQPIWNCACASDHAAPADPVVGSRVEVQAREGALFSAEVWIYLRRSGDGFRFVCVSLDGDRRESFYAVRPATGAAALRPPVVVATEEIDRPLTDAERRAARRRACPLDHSSAVVCPNGCQVDGDPAREASDERARAEFRAWIPAPGSGRFDRPLTAGPVIVGGYKLDGDAVSADFSRAVDLHAAALEFVDADRAWVLAVSASVDGGAGAAAFDAATVARDAAIRRLISESHVYAVGVRRFDPVLAVALAEVGDARAAKRAAAPAPARVVCPVCSLSLAADGSCAYCSSAETRALGRSVSK